jgi:hypothetical protein
MRSYTTDRQEPHEALATKVTRLKEKLTKLTEQMGKLAVYRKADAGFARPADILDRSRQSINGDERSRVRRRLQRAGRRRYRTSSDCCARSHEERLRPGATGQYG